MSALTDSKPAAPKRQRRAAKPQSVPAAELTALEIRAAVAIRMFKPDTKQCWVETLERIADKHQSDAAAVRPARMLRLVVGGAQ